MVSRMKAFVFENRLALDDLRVVERLAPAPGARQVLLRMRAASLNYRDLSIARGEYGRYPLPLVPVSDGAGTIVALGSEVRRLRVGDLVCPSYVPDWLDGAIQEETARRRLGGPVDGVLRELLCVDEEALVRAPAHFTPAEAATLPIAGVTAWQALFADGRAVAGQTVAVQGSGGVSLFVVQLARAAGLRVLCLLRGTGRRDALERLGAEVFDSTMSDWPEHVLAATGGRGVDLFVDIVGGPMLAKTILATRVGGSVVLLGYVGGTSVTLDLLTVIRRAVTLHAVSGGSRTSFEQLVRFLEVHELRPVIDARFPFAELRAAYDYLVAGKPLGKVVIDFAQGELADQANPNPNVES
jgi:NADPH:quinone reductase-like Zn-dependent oxidoreductase